jgi:hypothetical protein
MFLYIQAESFDMIPSFISILTNKFCFKGLEKALCYSISFSTHAADNGFPIIDVYSVQAYGILLNEIKLS